LKTDGSAVVLFALGSGAQRGEELIDEQTKVRIKGNFLEGRWNTCVALSNGRFVTFHPGGLHAEVGPACIPRRGAPQPPFRDVLPQGGDIGIVTPGAHGDTVLPEGAQRATGSLTVNGHLTLKHTILLVDGDLTVTGGLNGSGTVYVNGKLTVGCAVDFNTDDVHGLEATGGEVFLGDSGGCASVSSAVTTSATGVTATVTCTGPTACLTTDQLTTTETTGSAGQPALVARAARAPRRRTVIVGSRTVRIARGETAKVTVKLNATGRALLSRFGRLPLRLTIVLVRGRRRKVMAQRTLTLRPGHRRPHKQLDAPVGVYAGRRR
jgi:hypothetical protein